MFFTLDPQVAEVPACVADGPTAKSPQPSSSCFGRRGPVQ